uniref:Uncharacterized protein n=1 Tax=Thermogemmatispora argillosa TaxID=2045280 RepID=A0A455SUK4_9CHLR|nr:hypothetical protein KTA_03020 [Thermogemmatispora argillosa]
MPYLLPRDLLEDQRLNYQYHALYRTLSNHYLAPLTAENTRTILDVGTGIWAFELHALFLREQPGDEPPASAGKKQEDHP